MSAMLDVTRIDEWTVERLDAFLATPSDDDLDWPRFELIDGTLLVSPPPLPVHELAVVTDAAIRSGRSTVSAVDVLLAIEIESPSSITTDRITKPAQYAAAGIARYWWLETDPLRLITYRLAGDVYVETGSWAVGETAAIAEPFALTLDLASLLPS